MTAAMLVLWYLIAAANAFDPFQAAGIDRLDDARVPLDLAFLTETGATTTIGDLAGGRPIVLVPVLHNCPNICGATLGGLAQAIANQSYVPGLDFAVIAVSIDPRETPADARAALERLDQTGAPVPAMHALTGSPDAIGATAHGLGYRYAWDERIGQYAHVAAIAVLAADGRLVRWLYGVAPDPADLKLALTEAGEGTVGGWSDQLLLLCYHYDPDTGRYGSIVTFALRAGGVLTIALLAGFIGFTLWRDRRRA